MSRDSYQAKSNGNRASAEEKLILDLVKFGLDGQTSSVRHLSRKLLRKSEKDHSKEFRQKLGQLLVGKASSPVRSVADIPLPVEPESRLPLARIEVGPREDPPILDPETEKTFEQLVESRVHAAELVEAGVEPPKTVLLTGPPGVGKSMTARALAVRLELPLIAVELSTLMSSFLGKTGQNLGRLLDHGREVPSVLFLDEFDAVAKSRDDLTEIGELKRLVNMLLLELDRWPSSGLLVAATNHPQLLDPAVERRFDIVLDLPLPKFEQRVAILSRAIGRLDLDHRPSEPMIDAIALAYDGRSGAALERLVAQSARTAVIGKEPISEVVGREALGPLRAEDASRDRRVAFAGLAAEIGMTQREIASLLGVSHPTVGRLIKDWRAVGAA
jgi:ATPase family associated with various cellular activities (AAA)/Homeodomain-like domain